MKKHADTHLIVHARIWPAKGDRNESVSVHVASLNEYPQDKANEFEAPRQISSYDPEVVAQFRGKTFPCFARMSTKVRSVPARDDKPARSFENIRSVSDFEPLTATGPAVRAA